jgi:hypothetical protein
VRSDERFRGFELERGLLGLGFREGSWEAPKRGLRFDPNNTTGGGTIYQQHTPIPELNGRSFVVGSWVVAGQPAGVCFREDVNAVTNDDSCFLPHWISGTGHAVAPEPVRTPNAGQAGLREALYDEKVAPTAAADGSSNGSRGHHGGGSWMPWLYSGSSSGGSSSGGSSSGSNSSKKGKHPGSAAGSASTAAGRPSRPPPPPAPPARYHQARAGFRASSGGIGRKFGSAAS